MLYSDKLLPAARAGMEISLQDVDLVALKEFPGIQSGQVLPHWEIVKGHRGEKGVVGFLYHRGGDRSHLTSLCPYALAPTPHDRGICYCYLERHGGSLYRFVSSKNPDVTVFDSTRTHALVALHPSHRNPGFLFEQAPNGEYVRIFIVLAGELHIAQSLDAAEQLLCRLGLDSAVKKLHMRSLCVV